MYPAQAKKLSDFAADMMLSEWDVILTEVGTEAFDQAIRLAIRNSEFFPSIATLRQYAGLKQQDEQAVDAAAAWEWVIGYLRKWGVEAMPQYFGGKEHRPPEIPERIDYAMRRVGGLRAINFRDMESEPFMRKEFAEAYRQYETAEVRGLLGGDARKLLGSIKALAEGKQIQ